mmetsp:Transcript_89284/g.247951  ORF Transcript_89284/g.247951 Transcript_89284/m.247951 type:complete len:188 (+) Transcript_89284:94-657(+)
MAGAADMASGRMMFNEPRDEEFEGPRDVAEESPLEDIPHPLDEVPAPQTIKVRSFAALAQIRPLTDLLVILDSMADTVAEKDNEAASGACESAQQTAAGGAESVPVPCSGADKSCARVRASSCMAGSYALSMRKGLRQPQAHGPPLRGRSAQRVPVPPKTPPPPSNRRRVRAAVGIPQPPSAASGAA